MDTVWQSSHAGSLAPFLSAFTSPLLTKWMKKLTFFPVLLVVVTPSKKEMQGGEK